MGAVPQFQYTPAQLGQLPVHVLLSLLMQLPPDVLASTLAQLPPQVVAPAVAQLPPQVIAQLPPQILQHQPTMPQMAAATVMAQRLNRGRPWLAPPPRTPTMTQTFNPSISVSGARLAPPGARRLAPPGARRLAPPGARLMTQTFNPSITTLRSAGTTTTTRITGPITRITAPGTTSTSPGTVTTRITGGPTTFVSPTTTTRISGPTTSITMSPTITRPFISATSTTASATKPATTPLAAAKLMWKPPAASSPKGPGFVFKKPQLTAGSSRPAAAGPRAKPGLVAARAAGSAAVKKK